MLYVSYIGFPSGSVVKNTPGFSICRTFGFDPWVSIIYIYDIFRYCSKCCLVTKSCPTLCGPMDCSLSGSSICGIFPGKKTGVGCHFLLQGIFLTQELNPGLLYWVLGECLLSDSLPLSQQGSIVLSTFHILIHFHIVTYSIYWLNACLSIYWPHLLTHGLHRGLTDEDTSGLSSAETSEYKARMWTLASQLSICAAFLARPHAVAVNHMWPYSNFKLT